MNKNQEEKQYLVEQNKSKYKNDNGFIIGFPSLTPAERLTENITTFTIFRFSLKIEKKMMDILIKIGVCDEDDKVEDIDIFFRNDEEEEKAKEDDEEEYEEDEEKEDEKEQKIKANDEAFDTIKDKIRKEVEKKIFKELKNLFKEYALITRSAFRDFYYYYRVIENLYKVYKKNIVKMELVNYTIKQPQKLFLY